MGTLVQSWLEKGVEQGVIMTEIRMKTEIAKRMLAKGKDIEEIIEFTDLSYQEIQQLQNTK